MVASWTVLSTLGCAAGMQYEASDPDGGEGGSITVGATAGGGGARRGQELDRSRVPGVAEPRSLDLPDIEDYQRDNGLRVVLVERHDLPLVSLELLFAGGASAH